MEQGKIIFQGKTKTGKDLIIRYPTINDVQNITDFINRASKEKTYITFQGEVLSLEDETKYVQTKIDLINKKLSVLLLAFINGELAGSSDIDSQSQIRCHQGVFGIIVDKKYRSEGIGTILMKTVINEAIKNIKNLKIVTLEVMGTNTIAQGLYKKIGFVEFGRLKKGIKHKNKFVDQVFMSLSVR